MLEHPEWFDAKDEPFKDERLAYQSLVWQCRYSDIEVPDTLWRHATFGYGKPFADDQAEDMVKEKKNIAIFDRWVADFIRHTQTKGLMPHIDKDERAAKTTTNTEKSESSQQGSAKS